MGRVWVTGVWAGDGGGSAWLLAAVPGGRALRARSPGMPQENRAHTRIRTTAQRARTRSPQDDSENCGAKDRGGPPSPAGRRVKAAALSAVA